MFESHPVALRIGEDAGQSGGGTTVDIQTGAETGTATPEVGTREQALAYLNEHLAAEEGAAQAAAPATGAPPAAGAAPVTPPAGQPVPAAPYFTYKAATGEELGFSRDEVTTMAQATEQLMAEREQLLGELNRLRQPPAAPKAPAKPPQNVEEALGRYLEPVLQRLEGIDQRIQQREFNEQAESIRHQALSLVDADPVLSGTTGDLKNVMAMLAIQGNRSLNVAPKTMVKRLSEYWKGAIEAEKSKWIKGKAAGREMAIEPGGGTTAANVGKGLGAKDLESGGVKKAAMGFLRHIGLYKAQE